jgi:hypothetical protein
MRIHKLELLASDYQTVTLPIGAAPLAVQKENGLHVLYFIGEDTLVGQQFQDFGLFIIPTGVSFPDDLRLFPVPHVLTGTVDQANARYISTVEGSHIFIGNPREHLLPN